jgi:hypothetical protein
MLDYANKNRLKINTNQKKYQETIKGRSSVLLNAAKKRAKLKGELFELTLDDVIKGISVGYCARTLFPFDLKFTRDKQYQINPYSPSIDKINSKEIYKPTNVQYVCSWYNFAKGQMTDEQLRYFCKRVVDLCL